MEMMEVFYVKFSDLGNRIIPEVKQVLDSDLHRLART